MRVLLCFLFSLCFISLKSQTCIIEHELDYENIHTCIYVHEDSTNSISIYNAIFDTLTFTKVATEFFYKGFSNSSFIFKIPIQNNTAKKIQYFFSIKNPGIQEITFIESFKNEVFQIQKVGEQLVFNKRILEDNNYTFELEIPALESRNFYFIIRNYGNIVKIPMSVESFQSYHNTKLNSYFLYSFFYGLLLFACLFNVLLFFTFKDKLYIITSAGILFIFLYVFTIDGFSVKYLWNSNTWLATRASYIIAIVSVLLYSYAIQLFYNMHVMHKVCNIILKILYGVLAVLLLCSILPYQYFVYCNYILYAIVFIVITVIVIFQIKIIIKKVHYSKMLFFASIVLVITFIWVLMFNLGILHVPESQFFNAKIGLSIHILLVSVAVSARFRSLLIRSKEKLEFEVKLRTIEIEAQKDYLYVQKEQIQTQNKELNESIRYASRIQQGILPSLEFFQSLLPKSFIYFNPKDIISGDFYWISYKRGKIIIACADCTGHGIPGAFLSMLGISYLNTIVNEQGVTKPDLILNFLRGNIVKTLWKNTEQEPMYDGMNITLCSFDVKQKILEYAGAYNPFYIVRKKSLIKLEPDKMPIGVHIFDKPFSLHRIQLEQNDRIYLFTDGFVDQIGGPEGKKLKRAGFKQLLLDMQGRSMNKQNQKVQNFFQSWKQSHEQIDDVTVIGFEVE